MRAYAVVVVWKNGEFGVSQEAYSCLKDAQRFVENRKPSPEKVSPTKYRDDEGREYNIYDLRVIEPKGKRKFWGVSQKYFDSGKVKVNVFPVEADDKPESTQTENKMCDEYIDYFDTHEEALEWAEQAKKA